MTTGATAEMLDLLCELCPVQLRQAGRACTPVLPAGSCRCERRGSAIAFHLLGWPAPLPVCGDTPAGCCSFPVRGAAGMMDLVFLPDQPSDAPGVSGPRRLRAYYDQRLAWLLGRRRLEGLALDSLSSRPDPFRRYPGGFCRLRFHQGARYLAGLALYPFQGTDQAAAFLTAALGWFDFCRSTRRHFARTVVLLVHSELHLPLLGRLELLDGQRVQPLLCCYDLEQDTVAVVDPAALARETRLPVTFEFSAARPLYENSLARALVARYPADLRLEKTPHAFDQITCRGLPLVQIAGPREEDLRVGWQRPFRPWPELGSEGVRALAEEVLRIRREPSPRPRHPAFRSFSERWLEHQVLENLPRLEPGLSPSWTYRQVPTYRGTGRSIMDVLSLDAGRRLAVIEIKAAESETLLFQALDYWERVWDGLQSDAFYRCGYFQGVRLDRRPPDLYLVTPLFRCHRDQHLLASYLAPRLRIVLVEVNLGWRQRFRVIRRSLLGAP